MNPIFCSIKQEREYIQMLSDIASMRQQENASFLVTGLCDGAKNSFYSSLLSDISSDFSGILFIVGSESEAVRVSDFFQNMGKKSLVYHTRDFSLYNITSSHEYEYKRLKTLYALITEQVDCVVTTPEALLQYTIPMNTFMESSFSIKYGNTYRLENIIKHLEKSGYVRCDMVDCPGQYTVRGGILDVFSPHNDFPIRIDFWGDEVDKIAAFDVMSQRRLEELDEYFIIPAREIFMNEEKKTALSNYLNHLINMADNLKVREKLQNELNSLMHESVFPAIDKYISVIYDCPATLMDYFDSKYLLLLQEMNQLEDSIKNFEFRMKNTIESILEDGYSAKNTAFNKWKKDFQVFIDSHTSIVCNHFLASSAEQRYSKLYSFNTRQTEFIPERLDLLCEDILQYLKNEYKIVLSCDSGVECKNYFDILQDNNIPVVIKDDLSYLDLLNGIVFITSESPSLGYELISTHFVCFSTSFHSHKNRKQQSGRKIKKKQNDHKKQLMSYADLQMGDYVVHEVHGIGKFDGIQTLTVDNVTKDYIKIQYAGTDVVYVPCNQLDLISKYIGPNADNAQLKLSKIGSTEWNKSKKRVKSTAKSMAKELIALYATRLKKEGFAFSKDDDLQSEFNSTFEYEETDAQLLAYEEICKDMENTMPMDRLLCGDVGFGKTEVAMRAAFKAAADGKQVAVLVPTTILAMQHYQTFLSRFRGFAINVDMLSRFRTAKQQAESLRKLKRGETDVIIGTHRLISNDIHFKDLGLLIIDEEQRFGVAAKEKLKSISENVDVLTLTATPIPRTLSMSMSGIRDISILDEPPADRMPVQSYVLEYDDSIIYQAIRNELDRGGQIFYLHNAVDDIERTVSKLKGVFPDIAISIAHGQMDKETLSDVWRNMISGEIQLLICTTIIETGIDIPNANTLIIENADKMGLSQLHQLRGRIGRSSRRGYAYFTYRRGKVLTEVAYKRLMAIREYTEFGSGFKIALRDLEIRGAGNILGAEQHGHIENVGYDLYMKLLEEAVLEEKGVTKEKNTECTISIDTSAYIPENYIPSSAQRIEIYKKISLIQAKEDREDILDELIDRFGEPPTSVLSLLDVSLLRGIASKAHFEKITQRNTLILFYPEKFELEKWSKIAFSYQGKLLVNAGNVPYVSLRIKQSENASQSALELLEKYITNS